MIYVLGVALLLSISLNVYLLRLAIRAGRCITDSLAEVQKIRETIRSTKSTS
jgi:hypothetical protein